MYIVVFLNGEEKNMQFISIYIDIHVYTCYMYIYIHGIYRHTYSYIYIYQKNTHNYIIYNLFYR